MQSITVLPRHAPDMVATPAGIEQAAAQPARAAYSLAALRLGITSHFDIVFCGHLYMAPLAAFIARLARAKLIMQMHGIEAWQGPTAIQRAAVESADLVLCVSRYTRARVLDWAAMAPERVLVLPNTVGHAFTPGDGSRLRKSLGLGGKRVLLTVGRIDSCERYKGHDRVIKALPQLVGEGHDVVYLVVGEGDDAGWLEAMAVEAGVAGRVPFLGAVDPETLVEVYRMADIFVMPSTGEGFGIAFLEAMASGTPAIGLPVAGTRDALADGELGVAASEAELTSAIARLLEGPRPDPTILSKAVRARFGREAFGAGAGQVIERLRDVA